MLALSFLTVRGERNAHWSHDGQEVVIGVWLEAGKFETWRVNADGTGRTRLPIAETEFVLDCTRDGTWLATRSMGGDSAHWGRLTLVHPDGTRARTLTEGSAKRDVFSIPEFSPDGQSIAYVEIKTEQKVRRSRLFVMDLDGATGARFRSRSNQACRSAPTGRPTGHGWR